MPIHSSQIFNTLSMDSEANHKTTVISIIRRRLEDEARIITAGSVVNVRICSKAGLTADAILKAAAENNADMIIAGMKKTTREYVASLAVP